eukprot:292160-Pelagomonas_calceolata.AAC.8
MDGSFIIHRCTLHGRDPVCFSAITFICERRQQEPDAVVWLVRLSRFKPFTFPTCWAVAASRVEMASGQNLNSIRWMSLFEEDISRIKVGRSASDRAHKDSTRAALVPGRGASTIRENTVRDSLEDGFKDFYALSQESFIPAEERGLHRSIRLQRQLSGNTEACNQTWPKNAQLTKADLEKKITSHNSSRHPHPYIRDI